ncbi:MAG: TrmH family RNA methyltransferase [Candidatus Promineifilaceae bacterium]
MDSDKAHSWMEGHVSVTAALQGGFRDVQSIYLRKGRWNRATNRLRELAAGQDVPVEVVDEAFFAANAGGQSHGGVLARVGQRRYVPLEMLAIGHERPFVVMLDGIEDPFNFGQAVRACFAAGANGLVLRERNWLSATAVVTRASAGATELIPAAVVPSALDAATALRAQGLAVACTTRRSAISLYDADLTQAIFMLIGGEKRGVTRSFLEQADLRLAIPYGRPFEQSLGAAPSAAVLAFELMRQRSAQG